MNNTHIQWCDYSANVIKYRDEDGKSVWACVKVSDGCKNCYSETLAKRYGRGGPFTVGATAKVTPYFDESEAKALLSPKRLPAGSKVFIGDMTDVFGPWVPDELLDRLFAVFALRPDVVFQVLTKRPERMREYMAGWVQNSESGHAEPTALDTRWDAARRWLRSQLTSTTDRRSNGRWEYVGVMMAFQRWPLPNVWLGTSVEDQSAADKRIPELLATPAAVHFLSCEPLLGPVDLDAAAIVAGTSYVHVDIDGSETRRLHWVIAGGESGPGARPCDIGWVRGLVGQCQAAGVPVFVKQDSGPKPGKQGRIPSELWLKEFPDAR